MNDWSHLNILVVEDDLAMLEMICLSLQRKQAQIFTATNGVEAFDIVESKKVDIVISDIIMPVMDGVELLKKIRERDPTIPIVLLATGQSQLTEEEALASGAKGLIHKPFKMQFLLNKIEELILNIKSNGTNK